MRQVDLSRVRQKTGDMLAAVATLRSVLDVRTDDAIMAEPLLVSGIKYEFLRAVEAAIGLCLHLSVRVTGKPAGEYAQCFRNLGESGVIDQDLARRLAMAAGLRNLLVHEYGRVDDARFLALLRAGLADFERFAAAVGRFLGADP